MGMNTGERIKQARLAAGLTQTELKEILGTGNVDVTFSLKSE